MPARPFHLYQRFNGLAFNSVSFAQYAVKPDNNRIVGLNNFGNVDDGLNHFNHGDTQL